MALTVERMIELVTELAEAKSRQHIEQALAIYHEDIELITPSFESHGRGRAEVHKQLVFFFRLFPDYDVEVSEYSNNDGVLLAEGRVKVTPNTAAGKAQTARVPVFMEFHFEDDAIRKEVFNWDLSLVASRAGITESDLLSPGKL